MAKAGWSDLISNQAGAVPDLAISDVGAMDGVETASRHRQTASSIILFVPYAFFASLFHSPHPSLALFSY